VGSVADVVGLVAEVFTWIGFGAGAALLLAALIAKIADGTWAHARGAVEATESGPVVRWFDDAGNVNEAALHDAHLREFGGRDMIDLWYRRGWIGRMRLQPGAPAVRALLGLSALMLAVGLLATIAQWVILLVEG
jgi:hypothetical protein